MRPLLLLLTWVSLTSSLGSKVTLSSDGGYGDLVVKIGREVPEQKCQVVLQNLKVRQSNSDNRDVLAAGEMSRLCEIPLLIASRLSDCLKWCLVLQKLFEESSLSVYDALDEEAYFKSVHVVVPNGWRETMCKTPLREPRGDLPYRVADVKVSLNSLI